MIDLNRETRAEIVMCERILFDHRDSCDFHKTDL